MSQIKKINGRMEISPTKEKLGGVLPAEKTDEAITLGQLRGYGGVTPYRKYVATLSQSGLDAPVATVLENTLGGTLVWSYAGVGTYLGTLSGAFTSGKTWFIAGNQADMATLSTVNSVDEVQLSTFSDIATAANGMMFTLAVEIRVYQ